MCLSADARSGNWRYGILAVTTTAASSQLAGYTTGPDALPVVTIDRANAEEAMAMAGKTPMPRDPEDQQNDLLATLAAARELGPDMDKALVESYLQRQPPQPQPKAPAPAPPAAVQPATPGFPRPLYFTPALGIIAYIVLLVVSHSFLWWTFWLIPAFGGWGWCGGHSGNLYQRYADREEWRRARWERRYGDGRYDQSQPTVPPAQQSSPPAAVAAPERPQQPQQPQPPIEYD